MRAPLALAGLALMASLSAAHSIGYVNISGDTPSNLLTDCTGDRPALGVVCFAGGHIAPDEDGQATVSITDALVSPVSAFHCVDLDQDLVCGEERDNVETFCGAHVMTIGEDWDGIEAVFLYVDGALFRNPLLSACGTLSAGTTGKVNHT